MSRRLSRRNLFTMLFRDRDAEPRAEEVQRALESPGGRSTPPVPQGASFSLEGFYAGRAAADEAPQPRVELRPGLEQLDIPTTSVGVPELARRRPRRR